MENWILILKILLFLLWTLFIQIITFHFFKTKKNFVGLISILVFIIFFTLGFNAYNSDV